MAAIGSRGSPRADGLARLRGEALDLVEQLVDPHGHRVASTSGSPTDGRLIRTLAAAPRAAASPRSDATLRSLEALTLLRPASASAAATSSTQASTQRSGTSDAHGRGLWSAAVRLAFSSSVSRGSFIAAANPA